MSLPPWRPLPFYLTGRPNQRNLVLRWLEESYESKEPVALAGLTIEHVLPQSLTDAWIAELGLAADEDPEQVHAELVHTLANLTLTGYNSVLSNSPFHVKREQLATSGLRMNQEIAKEDHWGVSQLKARAARLAARITETWPGPVAGALPAGGPNWPLLATALAALPAGSWTSYGDLAALIGSHAVPVGQYIASTPVPNAHRVLKAAGVVSPDFRWLEPGRTDSPEQMLRDEGVEFDDSGRASKAQRFTSSELAALVGLSRRRCPPNFGCRPQTRRPTCATRSSPNWEKRRAPRRSMVSLPSWTGGRGWVADSSSGRRERSPAT